MGISQKVQCIVLTLDPVDHAQESDCNVESVVLLIEGDFHRASFPDGRRRP